MSDHIHKCTRTSQPPQSHGEPSGSSSECSFTGIWHVTYNAENRPVLFSNETAVVSMSYDYMGRRFEYKETVNNTITRHERYLYRGYLQLAAIDMLNSSIVKHTIVWDAIEPTATRPLCISLPTADSQLHTVYYSFDQVKNVTEIFDSTGAILIC